MRSQIIYSALDQEGLTGGTGKEGEEEERRGGDKRRSSKLERQSRKSTKGRRKADCKEKKSVSEAAAGRRRREEKKKRKWEQLKCYCAFLSGWQSAFIAQSVTVSSRVFSAPAMTAANLCKDMDYTRAKLATKHSIIHAPFSVWPGCLYKAAIRAVLFLFLLVCLFFGLFF